MRTIFITSFHSLIARNILATSLLPRLSEAGFRAVVLAGERKINFFEKEFGGMKNVVLEKVSFSFFWREQLMRYLALALADTRSLAIKRRTEMKGSGLLLSCVSRAIFPQKFLAKFVRFLERVLAVGTGRGNLFEKYKPALVFTADAQNDYDILFIKEAKKRKIPVLGMVRSWDNLTSKGLLRAWPDKLLVNNEIIKMEAEEINAFPGGLVEIIGVPHYDGYLKDPRASRGEFCEKLGMDSAKKFILFAPTGDRYLRRNNVDREVLEILDRFLPKECQILARFPPTDSVNGLDGRTNEGRIFFDRPTRHFHTAKKEELSREDDAHLADTLRHCALLVTGPSTMAVDAALFDKPIVLVAFDGYTPRLYLEGLRRYYDYDHWQVILESGGAKLAENREDFEKFVAEYLQNPHKDAEKRKSLIEKEAWKLDGNSTERLLRVIVEHSA